MATRAAHRRRTLQALSDAAVASFAEHGPGATIDGIAERAGVSRRTVFRYVDSKEELAFIHPVLWFEVFDAGLEQAPAFPLADRLRAGSRAIALHIDRDPEPARRAFAVVARHPELARGFDTVFQRWVDRVAEEVRTTVGPDPATDRAGDATGRFRSRIIGAAVMGMVDAVVREWVNSAPQVAFTDLYDEGFELLVPLLDQAGAPSPGGMNGPGSVNAFHGPLTS